MVTSKLIFTILFIEIIVVNAENSKYYTCIGYNVEYLNNLNLFTYKNYHAVHKNYKFVTL